jgi:putative transposase
MYQWRRMVAKQRNETLQFRLRQGLPWHSPPHYEDDSEVYLITAACFEQKPILGLSPARMADFEAKLLLALTPRCPKIFAWIVLPNHYHVLVHAPRVTEALAAIGQLHGRMSHHWNGEEQRRRRQVWHRAVETAKSVHLYTPPTWFNARAPRRPS